MPVTLLGPQRRPTVDRVVRALHLEGTVATVTAGWQEGEGDDRELDEQLGGRSENLRLYERWGEVQAQDPEFATAIRRRRDELQELRHTYLIRLGHALGAVQDLAPDAEEAARRAQQERRARAAVPAGDAPTAPSGASVSTGAVAIDRGGGDAVRIEVAPDEVDTEGEPITPRHRRSAMRAEAHQRAIDDVRRIDAEHLARLDVHNNEFIARWAPHERESVARHRAEVADRLDRAAGLALAGGHVGVLLAVLHLFAVDPPRRLQMIAWSAGAMALTERVVLYHDRTVQGPSDPEVYGRGLSVVRDVVALPHARTRLLLDDADRMAVLRARFQPARCLLLEPGSRLAVSHEGDLPANAVVLGLQGRPTVESQP